MKIAFHGAARTVTGSKHLITLKNGKKILLDCGMFQGMGPDTDSLNRDFGFDPQTVTYMVLSHAHIDHSGLIPRLVKMGYAGDIYCTAATRDMTEILLLDSAEIQEDDVKFTNKKKAKEGLPYVTPLYTVEDAKIAIGSLKPVNFNTWIQLDPDIQLMFTDAGHIVGAACVHLRITENGKTEQITFSGDIGRYNDDILKSPAVFPQADYILMESTYGSTLHADAAPADNELLRYIQETCIQKKGKLIIPAFSVGRTQELLYALNKAQLNGKLPPVDIFVDSPLSTEATAVTKAHPEVFNKEVSALLKRDSDPFDFPGLKYIKTVDQSKLLNFRKEPCVIISASGMAEAGRVKHHIANNIDDERNTILIVGYCEPESLGGRLMRGAQEVSIYGTRYKVNAEVGVIRSMSAHGDYEDLSQWLACQDPKEVKKLFLVHGEYEVQKIFKKWLFKKGFLDIEIPERHFELGLS
ncbi:metallo-beta-lactamase family protein [Chitinophaga terrae (ex Kim and Jung 2007)]|jgi:metallo-beta-lactamase family protein|uniref:Metallo-beta-lactamase family protein n=1 Tax=Chitinophaga terrae (ex Kim and Jung 2007) TaxID=408074 RepID=A0A1H3YB09_9BACT|nr:MBL fold metallo-hydrolase [Chitinophaga terrae (ex Kim and Jung 2007)]MDQ0107915.1 metallo-beta-lactamase family protein [Chitinophaga terrae (ex Kim and Jung 2007)]SEA08713.1 metallo-beta-lactamase family protein [Chitinophaga terrae (ex Kim and Jung 2007)]